MEYTVWKNEEAYRNSPVPVVYIHSFRGNGEDVWRAYHGLKDCPPMVLVSVNNPGTGLDDELSPWPAEGVWKGQSPYKGLAAEHLLWMEDLTPIYRFQPFADMLKSADDTRVADIMREEFVTVDREVPAVQLAKLFLVHQIRKLIITGPGGKLAGVVELKEFCAKLFCNPNWRCLDSETPNGSYYRSTLPNGR